jgi:hypothetical protein
MEDLQSALRVELPPRSQDFGINSCKSWQSINLVKKQARPLLEAELECAETDIE